MPRASTDHKIATPSSTGSNWAALKKTLPSTLNAPWRKNKRKRVDEEAVNEPVASTSTATALQPDEATKADPGKHVALDCEFVGVGPEGAENMLARVSVVNFHGHVLLDVFVKPKERVIDYRTWVSGVTESDLRSGGPAISFEEVQKKVSDLLTGRILVGHAVHNDLQVLLLSHPRATTRDTARYAPLRELAGTKRPALRKLSQLVLGVEIQDTKTQLGHSSVEDARATMAIYRAHRKDWEASLQDRRPVKTSSKPNPAAYAKPDPAAAPQVDRPREKGRKKSSLNLAATIRHSAPDDERRPTKIVKKARTGGDWWAQPVGAT